MSKFNIGIHRDGYSVTHNTEDGPVEGWQEVFLISASSPKGETWALIGSETETEAEADLLLRTLDHDPASRPDAWAETRPLYGSEAWGCEDEYELACFEADAFGEPRPHW